MAISSPNVVNKEKPDLLQAGMQIGQMLQQKKQADQVDGLTIFKTLDMIAKDPSMAGGWNALLKRPGVEQTLKGAFKKLGVDDAVSTELMSNLGESIPSIEASMQMAQGVQTYLAKGEKPPPEFYQSFKTSSGGGLQNAPPVATEITGQTYEWQDKQKTTTAAPGTAGLTEQQQPTDLRSASEALNKAVIDYDRTLTTMGYDPKIHGSKEKFIAQSKADVPEVMAKAQSQIDAAQQNLDTMMGQKPVDISTPSSTNAPQQQQKVIEGNWAVAKKNEVVGEVRGGIFRPNKDFQWTNETEMLNGLAKQTWGETKPDTEAFKNMLYESAKESGYKGSKEKFFYAKPNKVGMGRASTHGAWMPEWYDYAQKSGLKIKQPYETSTVDALKYSSATGPGKLRAISKTEDQIKGVVKKLADGIETTYQGKQASESGAGGYVKTDSRVPGYLTFEEAKANEKFLRKHLGHYSDLIFKDKKTYNAVMAQQKRIYENLGGDGILETLAPNKQQLEKAKFDAAIDQFTKSLTIDDKWKTMGFSLQSRSLDLQERSMNIDAGMKWNLAQNKAAESTSDFTKQLTDEGFKVMELYKDKLMQTDPPIDIGQLYINDPIFAAGYNNFLMVSAIRNGIDPEQFMEAIEYQKVNEPSALVKTLRSIPGPWGFFVGTNKTALPVVGGTYPGTKAITPVTQTEAERQAKLKAAQEQHKEDTRVTAESGIYD
jgi:hypothetical protein